MHNFDVLSSLLGRLYDTAIIKKRYDFVIFAALAQNSTLMYLEERDFG